MRLQRCLSQPRAEGVATLQTIVALENLPQIAKIHLNRILIFSYYFEFLFIISLYASNSIDLCDIIVKCYCLLYL